MRRVAHLLGARVADVVAVEVEGGEGAVLEEGAGEGRGADGPDVGVVEVEGDESLPTARPAGRLPLALWVLGPECCSLYFR